MTQNTAIKPTNKKTKIFSIMGAALLMTCLFAGFAQAADNDNGMDNSGKVYKTYHYVSCQSNGHQLGIIPVDCTHWGKNGYDHTKDLESCRNIYGPEVVQAFSMGACQKY